jgi:tetratricopeptide (TPR) repeat protein
MDTAELQHIHQTMDEAADAGDTVSLDTLADFLKSRIAAGDGPMPAAVYRLKYAETLMIRSGLVDDRAELRATTLEAVGTSQYATDLRVWLLGRLATVASTGYEQTGRPELVPVADTIFHLGLRDAGDGSDDQLKLLVSLANLHRQCLWRTRISGEAEQAVKFARLALPLARPGGDLHADALFNLGTALLIAAEVDQSVIHLEESVEAFLRLLGSASPGFAFWRDAMTNLRAALLTRDELPVPLTVDWAPAYQELTQRGPARDENEAELRCLAGTMLVRSAVGAGNLAALSTTLEGLTTACNGLPAGHRLLPLTRGVLCEAFRRRFELTGNVADLIKAIEMGRAGLAEDETADSVIALASALTALGEATAGVGPLTEAVDLLERLPPRLSADDRDQGRIRIGVLNALCVALRFRFDLTGAPADVNSAIAYGEQAAELAAADFSMRAVLAVCLLNLGTSYRDRYDFTDDVADLDLAIARLRLSVEVSPTSDPGLAMRLSNLGYALSSRYERSNALRDLDEAIAVTEQAMNLAPPGSPDHARYAGNLCSDLLARSRTDHDHGSDLQRACEVGRASVEETPPGHPLRGLHLTNLCNALREEHHRTGDREPLTEALRCAREAVNGSPGEDRRRSMYLSALRGLLIDQYQLTEDEADLRDALAAAREAVTLAPADTGARAQCEIALCEVLMTPDDPAFLAEATARMSEVAKLTYAPAKLRLLAAKRWGIALQRLGAPATDAYEAYRYAAELLPLLAWRGADHSDRESILAGETGLGTRAAAFALAAGLAEQAVEVLELSRGVFWSQLLDLRSDLDALRDAHPTHANRLETVRAVIDSGGPG